MAMLFAENRVNVSFSDPKEATMDSVIGKAEKAGNRESFQGTHQDITGRKAWVSGLTLKQWSNILRPSR